MGPTGGSQRMNRSAGYSSAAPLAPLKPLAPLNPLSPPTNASCNLRALPSLNTRAGPLTPATMITPEQEKAATELFHKFDANKNGKIEKTELKTMLQELSQLEDPMLDTVIKEIFNRADRDMSHAIEVKEFLEVYN